MADTFWPTPQFSLLSDNVPWVVVVPGDAPPMPRDTPRSDRSPRAIMARALRSQPDTLTRLLWPLAENRTALNRSYGHRAVDAAVPALNVTVSVPENLIDR